MKLKKTIALFLTVMICIMAFPINASAADYVKYKTANELVADLTAGWNLASSLDCIDYGNLAWDGYETAWGNPWTTKEMFVAVRKAGFNFVRIPVTWGVHMDENGNIDKEWMDRVQEVVDYAYDEGLFVIINTHNDGEWIKTNKRSYVESIRLLKNVWKQISARFKNYNQRLIFEGMNEPGDLDLIEEGRFDEMFETINELNKAFIETVRSSGGNNKNRMLMIPPFAAEVNDVDRGIFALEVPDDDKMIAVSIHAYQPWDFSDDTLDINRDITKFTDSGKKAIDTVFERIDEVFLSKGIPVIMGEFAYTHKSNTSERVKAVKYYISVAKKYGVPCAWWDSGISTHRINVGEVRMGLLHRETYEWYFPDIVKAIIDTAPESPVASTGKLKAPTGFKVTKAQTKITLKWDEVKGADAYRVYLYNEKTGKYETYKTVYTGICNITDLKKGTKYKFKVTPLIKNSKGKYVAQTSSKAMSATTKA